jgi:sugar lactone lactonase YvrE
MTIFRNRTGLGSVLLAACALLAACGGGGSGGGSVEPPPVQPPPVQAVSPSIISHPADQSVTAGASATFTVTATGDAPLRYQWFRNGTEVSGAVQASYTLATAALQDSGSRWSVRLTNDAGSVTSADAVLTVAPAPIPIGISLTAGHPGGPGNLDGKGREAYFNRPAGLAFDASGTAYVTDAGNRTVRKIAADGTVSTWAGTAGVKGSQDGTGSQALFDFPGDTAVSADGRIYVVDTGKLRRVSPDGTVATLSLTSNVSATAIAAAPDGALYMSSQTAVYRLEQVPSPGIIAPTFAQILIAGQESVEGWTDAVGANATFFGIADIAVDAARNIYVSQPRTHTIRKITADGTVTTFAGVVSALGSVDGTGSAARFSSPAGLALDASGNLWVADLGSGSFRRISPAGDVSTPYGRDFFTFLAFGRNAPGPIAFAPSGELYFGGALGISSLNSAGALTPVAGQDFRAEPPIGDVRGLGVDPDGNIVLGNFVLTQTPTSTGASVQLTKYGPGGERLPFQVSVPVVPRPYGGAGVDAQGNVYVSYVTSKSVAFTHVATGGSISRTSPEGVVSSVAVWTEDSPDRLAPGFMALGRDGVFYFVDLFTGNLVKWTAANVPTVLANLGTIGNLGALDLTGSPKPWIIAADAAGQVYVVMNGTVQRVENGGLVAVAGEAGQYGTADGTGAQARFAAPSSAVFDAAGNLYVGDREVIRKVTPAGVVSTVAGQRGKVGLRTGALPGSLGMVGAMAIGPDGVLHLISSDALLKVRLQ